MKSKSCAIIVPSNGKSGFKDPPGKAYQLVPAEKEAPRLFRWELMDDLGVVCSHANRMGDGSNLSVLRLALAAACALEVLAATRNVG